MFLQNFLLASKQILILYILVAIGFICDSKGIYTEKTAKLTNNLLVSVILPAMIIQSFLSVEYTKDNMKKLLIAALLSTVLMVLGVIAGIVFFRKRNDENNGIFRYGCAYGNVGFMGMPLAQSLFGAEGVFYCSVLLVVFNIFNFTHGMSTVAGNKAKLSIKQIFVNPGTIAIVIGLPLMIFGVKLPEVIERPLGYVASLNTPLAMIIFGTYLSKTNLKTMFSDKRIFLAAAVKLLIIPAAMLGTMKLMGQSGVLPAALMISSSAPSANTTVMFTVKYGHDEGLASKLVASVSFMSIITMPVMIALAQFL